MRILLLTVICLWGFVVALPPIWIDDLWGQLYNIGIKESLQVGTVIGYLRARDAEGQSLTYSTSSDIFAVNGQSGKVTLIKKLDFETMNFFTVTFTVRDSGGSWRSISHYVRIIDTEEVTEELVSTTYPIPAYSGGSVSTEPSGPAVPTVTSDATEVTSSEPTTSSTTLATSSASWVTSDTTYYEATTVAEDGCLGDIPSRIRGQAPNGTAKLSTQAKIVATAKKYKGSTKWSVKSNHRGLAGKPKCNIFVAEVLEEAGVPVPHRHWYCWSPIGAKEWANPKSDTLFKAAGWVLVKNPKPGDVVAFGGHCGIVTGKRLTTSASSVTGKIEENDWGFRKDQKPTFWRYRVKGEPVDQ